MRRIPIVSLLALAALVPGVAAMSHFSADGKVTSAKPCFVSGNAGYQFSASNARHIVRIDNTAAKPQLRMQLVDDPAAADFVLVDDSDATMACTGVTVVEIINIDAAAQNPDLTVAVSREPADYKIYLHSDVYTEQDAAALAAVIWQNAGRTGALGARTVNR
jgi:fructose-specific component phosphotransferase system IIB-like protein